MARFFRRRKFCRFTSEGVKQIDYKDVNLLKTTSPKQEKLFLAVSLVLKHVTNVSFLLV